MQKIRCFLVDDEISAIENLSALLLKHCPDVQILGSSTSITEAYTLIANLKPDVLFLDIRMQNESGFDLLKLLPGFEGSIIFVTAYDEYGLQAIKFSATDYLLKPIDINELILAIEKVRRKNKMFVTRDQVAMLIQSFESQKRNQQKKIALPESDQIKYVDISDIIYCKSTNSYTTFYLVSSDKITVSKPISDYEALLKPYDFLRVHQSYLVNTGKIKSYKKEDGGFLCMDDDSVIPISRLRKNALKDLFQ